MKDMLNRWVDALDVDAIMLLRDAVIDRLREDGFVIYQDPADSSPEQRAAMLAVIDGDDLANALVESAGSVVRACKLLNPTKEEIKELAGIEDNNDYEIVRLAAELAFTKNFSDWFLLIGELREQFKRVGATNASTAILLLDERESEP